MSKRCGTKHYSTQKDLFNKMSELYSSYKEYAKCEVVEKSDYNFNFDLEDDPNQIKSFHLLHIKNDDRNMCLCVHCLIDVSPDGRCDLKRLKRLSDQSDAQEIAQRRFGGHCRFFCVWCAILMVHNNPFATDEHLHQKEAVPHVPIEVMYLMLAKPLNRMAMLCPEFLNCLWRHGLPFEETWDVLKVMKRHYFEKRTKVSVPRMDLRFDHEKRVINAQSDFFTAILTNDSKLLCRALAEGAVVNCVGNRFRDPVHYAVKMNHFEVLHGLVQYGALTDGLDKEYSTPLRIAVNNSRDKICLVLLVGGARFRTSDERSCPYRAAMSKSGRFRSYFRFIGHMFARVRRGDVSVLEILERLKMENDIDYDVFMKCRNSRWDTLPAHALRYGHQDLFKSLLLMKLESTN